MKKCANIFTLISAACCVASVLHFLLGILPAFSQVSSEDGKGAMGIVLIVLIPIGIVCAILCVAAAISDLTLGIIGLTRPSQKHAKISAGLTALDFVAVAAILFPTLILIGDLFFVLPFFL
ncbi:MAG: hypothetical protein ACI4ST_05245, partial [Candidatus Gallimonas sp.]